MKQFQPAQRLRGIDKSMIRQVFDRAMPGSINLGLGEPDLPTPDTIRRAAVKAILEEQNGYTIHAGLLSLRELIAGDYMSSGITANDVIVTAGSQEALYLALLTIVDEGDEVLIPDPGFVAYPAITRMAGGTTTTYTLESSGGFSFDAETFRRSVTARTRVVVCISPSNPTGRVLSSADCKAIADALEGSGILVISDEIYRDLYFDEVRPASISDYYANTLVIGGLSKSMSMTGWRLGWICGVPEVIKAALILHGYVTTCASTVSQKAALAAWNDEAEVERDAHRNIFRDRRDFLMGRLKSQAGLNSVTPDGAFYIMVDIREFGSSAAVADALLKERVITVPGAAFGTAGEGFLRVPFCADHNNLAEGVERISRGLEGLKG